MYFRTQWIDSEGTVVCSDLGTSANITGEFMYNLNGSYDLDLSVHVEIDRFGGDTGVMDLALGTPLYYYVQFWLCYPNYTSMSYSFTDLCNYDAKFRLLQGTSNPPTVSSGGWFDNSIYTTTLTTDAANSGSVIVKGHIDYGSGTSYQWNRLWDMRMTCDVSMFRRLHFSTTADRNAAVEFYKSNGAVEY